MKNILSLNAHDLLCKLSIIMDHRIIKIDSNYHDFDDFEFDIEREIPGKDKSPLNCFVRDQKVEGKNELNISVFQ